MFYSWREIGVTIPNHEVKGLWLWLYDCENFWILCFGFYVINTFLCHNISILSIYSYWSYWSYSYLFILQLLWKIYHDFGIRGAKYRCMMYKVCFWYFWVCFWNSIFKKLDWWKSQNIVNLGFEDLLKSYLKNYRAFLTMYKLTNFFCAKYNLTFFFIFNNFC